MLKLRKTERKNEVEEAIRSRKIAVGRQLLSALLRSYPEDQEIFFFACESYRRLGLFQEGLAVTLGDEPPRSLPANTFEGQRLLWSALFLNLLGASSYALKIIERVKPITKEHFRIIGDIHLSNYHSVGAREAYTAMLKLELEPQSYWARIGRISLADSYALENDFSKAQSLAHEVLDSSSEPLMKAIAAQALGEYFARAESFKDALIYLNQSEAFFSDKDPTVDHALLFKWKAYTLCSLGCESEGKKYFSKAAKMLRRSDFRVEAWLDLLFLKFKLGGLKTKDIVRMSFFPGLKPGVYPVSKNLKSVEWGAKDSLIGVDFGRDEYRIKDQWHLGIPLEIQLVGYLRLVEDWGLNKARLKSILWPDESFSFFQIEGRLQSLVTRLRKVFGIKVSTRKGFFSLDRKDLQKVQLVVGTDLQGPRFFEKHSEFKAQDFGHFYGLSKTQSNFYLKGFLKKKLIEVYGHGRGTAYRVCGLQSFRFSKRASN